MIPSAGHHCQQYYLNYHQYQRLLSFILSTTIELWCGWLHPYCAELKSSLPAVLFELSPVSAIIWWWNGVREVWSPSVKIAGKNSNNVSLRYSSILYENRIWLGKNHSSSCAESTEPQADTFCQTTFAWSPVTAAIFCCLFLLLLL